jgi:hypothetical protein
MPSSSSETVQVEASRVANEDEIVSGVPTLEKMVEASALMGVAGANASSRASGSRANETVPRSIDAPSRAALTLGPSREPGLSPSQEATLDDVPYVPRSFNIVDLKNGELGLPGYPQAPTLPTGWGQVAGGVELPCS